MKLKKNIKIGKINVYILTFFLNIFFIFSLYADENKASKKDIKFVELNNDGIISYEEIEQSLNLLFQIIDLNQDNKISQNEINELKGIIGSLR